MARADAATLIGYGGSFWSVMNGAFHPPEVRHRSSTTPASLPVAAVEQARRQSLVGPRVLRRFGRPGPHWRVQRAPLAGAVVVFRRLPYAVKRGRPEERPLHP